MGGGLPGSTTFWRLGHIFNFATCIYDEMDNLGVQGLFRGIWPSPAPYRHTIGQKESGSMEMDKFPGRRGGND